jgi:hypothetical protein
MKLNITFSTIIILVIYSSIISDIEALPIRCSTISNAESTKDMPSTNPDLQVLTTTQAVEEDALFFSPKLYSRPNR